MTLHIYKDIQDHEDILLWPDDTWCYRHELGEFSFMSDDYSVLYFDTLEYRAYLLEQGIFDGEY